MIHSVGDANVNRSTLYRDGENFNLLYTFRRNPVLGSGFGHPFDQVAILDDISNAFREWRYLPHNSILGLWAFAGATGFSGLWLAIVVGSLLAVRAYASANSAADRTAALTAISVIMAYTIHCWGDIGFSEQKSIFLVGAALGISGQLAAATGGWPAIRAVGSLRLRM
jgi:O-antigen ligase